MLTLLLLGQAPTPDAVLKRLDQFLANSGAISVNIKVKVNGTSIGSGLAKINRPNRMSIAFTTTRGMEAIIFGPAGVLEVHHGSQMYAEHPARGRIYPPDYKVTGALGYAAPQALIQGSSRGLMPREANPKVTPGVMVNGVSTDLVVGKMESGGEATEIRLNVDAAGRLLRSYASSVNSRRGTIIVDQEMSNYAVNQKFADSEFTLRLPLGYVPHSLARDDSGIDQGSPMPAVELKSADSGRSASLKSLTEGKNTLVVVADAEFHANAALFKSIETISKKIPDFRLVVVSAKRDAASAKKLGVPNVYFDPTGAQLAKLQAPGVPAMYLVSKKGSLAQMFFGFDGQWEGLDQAIERLKKAG